MNKKQKELYEKLASIEHERWSKWQKHLHGQGLLVPGGILLTEQSVGRWIRQIETPYKDLSESERNRDREQVDKYWPLVKEAACNAGDITGSTSDGYHTFDELYEHRIVLFVALCKLLKRQENAIGHIPNGESLVWRSKLHSDSSSIEGWFIMGISQAKDSQITYHLPMRKWENTEFAETLDNAPEWDGHTPDEALKRLANI